MQLSRESAADKTSGRVGSDPSAIMKRSARGENAPSAASAGASG
jgi:hydroxyquinol 1,2-dioxygenase